MSESKAKTDVTAILSDDRLDSASKVAAKLMPLVYEELRELARRYLKSERGGHTLQPTALVHEAFLKLVDQDRVDWKGRTHFYAVGAQAMRRILVDYARARGRIKRGRGMKQILLDEAAVFADSKTLDLIELADTLDALASLDPRQAQIVELRFFAGLTVEQVAHVMGVSKRKVEGDWTHAKAWLRSRLGPDGTA